MKVAMLIQCHKNADQLNLLLETMKHPAFVFFIHVDKKSDICKFILCREDVIILPDEYRVDVHWAGITQVDATLKLLKFAAQHGYYDFFWVCSGQDFPIRPLNEIVDWFKIHIKNDFIELFESKNSGLALENNYDKRNAIFFPQWILGNEMWKRITKRMYTEITGGYNRTFRWARRKPVDGLKFYFGSSWVCLTNRTVKWIFQYLKEHPEFYNFMKNCNCPDESFFQTLIMNSPFANKRMDYLHYVDWTEGKSNPKVLTLKDLEMLNSCNKLMARKFDITVDYEVVRSLQEQVCLWNQ